MFDIYVCIYIYSTLPAHCLLKISDGLHFPAFLHIHCRYYYLAFRAHQMPETSKENAVTILERAKLENWVLGTTKVMQRIESQM